MLLNRFNFKHFFVGEGKIVEELYYIITFWLRGFTQRGYNIFYLYLEIVKI